MKVTKLLTLTLLGLLLPALGSKLNEKVVYDNSGKMPVWIVSDSVRFSLLLDPAHSALTSESHDKVFTDIIPVYAYYHGQIAPAEILSIGDVLIEVGVLLMIGSELMWLLWLITRVFKRKRKRELYVIYLR